LHHVVDVARDSRGALLGCCAPGKYRQRGTYHEHAHETLLVSTDDAIIADAALFVKSISEGRWPTRSIQQSYVDIRPEPISSDRDCCDTVAMQSARTDR